GSFAPSLLVEEFVSHRIADFIPRRNRRWLVRLRFTNYYGGVRRHSLRSADPGREDPIDHFLARPVAHHYYIERDFRRDVERIRAGRQHDAPRERDRTAERQLVLVVDERHDRSRHHE